MQSPTLSIAVLNSLYALTLAAQALMGALGTPPDGGAGGPHTVVVADVPTDVAIGAPTLTASDTIPLRPDDGRGTPYIVEKADNICGLDSPRQLTNPAVVDYDALLAATPEVQKIEKEKIDRSSSEGITLLTKARARVLKACESIRASQGHCSVWKAIRRRDGTAVSDITDAVKRKL